MRDMDANERELLRQREREAEAQAVSARKALIAKREYDRRGGYQRIVPLDLACGWPQTLDCEHQESLQSQLNSFCAVADEICA